MGYLSESGFVGRVFFLLIDFCIFPNLPSELLLHYDEIYIA